MKKILLSFLFFCAAGSIHAFEVPIDVDGIKAQSLDDVGVLVLTVRGNSSNFFVGGSSIAIFGVLSSTRNGGDFTAATTNFIEIRATNSANGTSELLLPALEPSTNTRNTFWVFDPPVIAPAGISVNVTSAATMASVFYRFLATGTDELSWIPLDSHGVKAHNSDFYGVKVATIVTAGATADGAMTGTEGLDYTSAERLVADRRGLLFGFMSGTGTVQSFAVFEDTASVLGDTADFLPSIFYNAMTELDERTSTTAKVFMFPWPIIFENGLSVRRSVAGDRFRVFTRPLRSLR